MSVRMEGELKRTRSLIEMLRAHLDAAEGFIDDGMPTSSTRQAITMTAASLAERMAVIDTMREARPSTRRHSLKPTEECESWCEACRENIARGFNPDGTLPEGPSGG